MKEKVGGDRQRSGFFGKLILRAVDSDRKVMFLTAGVIMAMMALFSWQVVPHLWDEMSVATGLRPPKGMFPGLWRGILSGLYSVLPPAAVNETLRIMGLVTAGLLSMMAFPIFDSSLPDVLRVQLRGISRGRMIARWCLVGGTVLFMCNEVVWRACQGFGALTFEILVAMTALWLVLGFFHMGGYWRLYLAMVGWGVIAGESPVGYVFAIALVVTVFRKALTNRDEVENPISNPLMRRLVIGKMLRKFLLAVLLTALTDYWLYGKLGGKAASESLPANVAVICLGGYWDQMLGAMSWSGWTLSFVFVLAPFVVALLPLKKALTDDKFIALPYAAAYFVLGVLAWLQCAGLSDLWFRSWFSYRLINDEFLVVVLAVLGIVTLLWAVTVFCRMYYYRSIRHIAGEQFQDAAETRVGMEAIRKMMDQSRIVRIFTRALPFVVLLNCLPMRCTPTLREMLGVIDDYVKEVVRESGESKWIFTDGLLDLGIELEAYAQGRRLLALSAFSGAGKRDVAIRQRDFDVEEDLKVLESGAADAMRYWTNEFPERLSEVVAQLGFERWRHVTGLAKLRLSGVLAHFGGEPGEDEKRGIEAAQALASRVIELYELRDPDDVTDLDVLRKFRFVQWRLSYLCRVRVDSSKSAVWGEKERRDETLFARLDELKREYESIRQRVSWMSEHHGAMLLPREGLKLGLQRADFRMAKTFAETILRSEPDDPHANFAVGMYYFMDGQYARAEEYLVRTLKRRLNDAAVLNNLSVLAKRLNRPQDALKYAERAARAAPNLKQISRTLEDARKEAKSSEVVR